jgi:hypothetical protein
MTIRTDKADSTNRCDEEKPQTGRRTMAAPTFYLLCSQQARHTTESGISPTLDPQPADAPKEAFTPDLASAITSAKNLPISLDRGVSGH